jgi:leukotriene-A4 hydrolase
MDTVKSYMSANITSEAATVTGTSDVETWFKCTVPIPNYLMAIATGNLVKQQVGRITYVITEPEDIDRCVAELVDMQIFLDEVEKYLTPYIWGIYQILILPPSFPMGGMENPLLTFASPTIIVGDKSQVSVVIHEMAHSWTGNTVTCRDWENFWLNEGFTVWVERHVQWTLFGYDFMQVSATLGNQTLAIDCGIYDEISPSYTSIHPVLKGDNPDASFTTVPYEKGFQFLYYINSTIGDEAF